MACVRAPGKEHFPGQAAASAVIVLQPPALPLGPLAASTPWQRQGDPVPWLHGWDVGATMRCGATLPRAASAAPTCNRSAAHLGKPQIFRGFLRVALPVFFVARLHPGEQPQCILVC